MRKLTNAVLLQLSQLSSGTFYCPDNTNHSPLLGLTKGVVIVVHLP